MAPSRMIAAIAAATTISALDLPIAKKAGLSGYEGIQNTNAWNSFAPHIAWYSDYTPNTPNVSSVLGVGMLWGGSGSACGDVASPRLQSFIDNVENTTPPIFFGFFEPDYSCSDSSQEDPAPAAADWNQYIAPLGKKGTILGSPSMAKQKDEDWLTPFMDAGLDQSWDVTSIHVNKPDLAGVQADVEYYFNTYGKPIWVSELACVHDQGDWHPCDSQDEVNQFLQDVIPYLESNENVVAYGPSNGNGLGDVWPLTNNGEITASGQQYLNVLASL